MKNYSTILIVDDDPIARGIFRTYFSGRGVAKLMEAANGIEALKLMDNPDNDVDLIQLDIYMPHMDGIELLRHLQDRDYTGDISIVSGAKLADRNNAVALASLYKLNVVGEVKKPLTKSSLEKLFDPASAFTGGAAAS